MKKYIAFVFLFILLGEVSAQMKQQARNGKVLPITELKRKNWYYSLEDAMKEPNKVYKLSLTRQKLKDFPMEVFLFKNLQVLNLAENRIDSLPPQIKDLKYLQILNLKANRIKEIPPEFAELKNLKYLYLSKNKIIFFPVEFCALKKLQYLDITFNKLSVYEVEYLEKCLPNTDIKY